MTINRTITLDCPGCNNTLGYIQEGYEDGMRIKYFVGVRQLRHHGEVYCPACGLRSVFHSENNKLYRREE